MMKSGAMSDDDEELIEALTAQLVEVVDQFFRARRKPPECEGNVARFWPIGRLDARETEIVMSAFVDAIGEVEQFKADLTSVVAILEKLGSSDWYGWIAEIWGRDVKPRLGS